MLNVVVKKEEGQHQEALKFFEFESPLVNVQEQQLQQQQQQLVVVVNNAGLFVSLFVVLPRNCASCQVHVAEKLLRFRATRPIGEN